MIQSKTVDIFLFKFFVFTLSLGHFIQLPFGDLYSKVVPQFSTSIMFVGFAFLLFKKSKIIDSRVSPFFMFWIFSLLYTFFVCSLLIFQYNLGFIDGIDIRAWSMEVPYRAVMRDIVFWTCCIMTILYSYYNLRYLVSFSELKNVIEASVVVVLIVGLLQFGVLNGNGFCSVVYYALSTVFKLVSFDKLDMLEKGICFWGSEPASASSLNLFIVPYSIITFIKSTGWHKIRFGFYVSLLLFLMLSSGSSSTLITSLIVVICTIIYIFRGTIKTWLYLASFLLGFIVVLFYTIEVNISSNVTSSDTKSVEYVLLGKLIDKENGSTATRVATVCNDMKIFFSNPVTGVGNGCQGYFYSNNIPEWTKFAREVQSALYYESGSISNGGGNFFASYISGYGIIGILVLFFFMRKYISFLKYSVVKSDPIAEFTFSVSVVIFFLAGWYVQTIEDNRLMFVLALGCVPYTKILNK